MTEDDDEHRKAAQQMGENAARSLIDIVGAATYGMGSRPCAFPGCELLLVPINAPRLRGRLPRFCWIHTTGRRAT